MGASSKWQFSSKGHAWQVDFTEPYMRNFKNLANPNLQEIVANAVERLARGKWPSNMLPHAAVPEQYKAIIQVFWVEGLCVIWMVDVDRDTRKQVLKVFALVKPADVSKSVRQLAHKLAGYTKEYLAQCKVPARPKGKESKKPVLPAEVAGIITWYKHPSQQLYTAAAAYLL